MLFRSVDKGIGLRNVNARIKNLYGKEYGIQIRSEEGKYTEIQIRIQVCKEILNGQKTPVKNF